MKPFVIAELDQQGALTRATRHVLTAATSLGTPTILVAGADCIPAARQAASLAGSHKVLLADHPTLAFQMPENLADLILALVADHTHLLIAANTFGHSLLPRVAALLGVPMVSNVVEILDQDVFVHVIHAGNIRATVRPHGQPILLSIRTSAFPAAPMQQGSAPQQVVPVSPGRRLTRHVAFEPSPHTQRDLLSARVVVAGGHGLAAGGSFAPVEELAHHLDAAIGATRAAVDAGLAPNDWQVGQTGKIIAPDLYLALGISGAIQHLAGIKDAKTIVAINNDPNAPIFSVADYGLTADLYEAIPELIQTLGAKS
ncbi:MAG: electron transfer flavoprotein subunit alpha/FixB family protein [Magnetococcales bacterium]|nr:electron transfer flavoprotein subunit alpha/FixB family protein [Magnetococcales bacterium]